MYSRHSKSLHSTALQSTAHYCSEALKLLFWWFKRWVASRTGLTYPHRQKFPSPSQSLGSVDWFFCLLLFFFSFRLVGVMWAAQAATAADTGRTTSKLTPQPMVLTAMHWSCTFCPPSGASQSCLLLISCCFPPSTTASPALWVTIVFFSLYSPTHSLSFALSFSWCISTCVNTQFSITTPLIYLSLMVCYYCCCPLAWQ